jgi:hypothetical protein
MTATTVTIGRSNVHHIATPAVDGFTATCGAVRYRNASTRGSVHVHRGAEVTCTKCIAASPAAIPAEAPAEPLTFMQRQRLAGKAR